MRTPSLAPAERELEVATEALNRMVAAASFASFELAWRDFLSALEKAWVKLEKACKACDQKKTQKWRNHHVQFRREDSLLQYLHQARNTDHHSVEELVTFVPGEYGFAIGGRLGGSRPGEMVHIERLRTDAQGRIVEYSGSHVPRIIDRPAQIRLLPVENRGVTFDVPSDHVGVALGRRGDPLLAAQLGLKFYSDTLNEAREEFF